MSETQALVLIDLQNDYFLGGKNPLVGAEAAVQVANRALEKAREKHEPIIHIQHVSLQPTATFFLPDTPGVEIHPVVAPQPNEIVLRKHYPNAFRETPLLDELRKHNVSRLFFCGMMTHMCVDTTVRAATDLGFTCVVVGDATATKDLTYRNAIVPAAQVQAAFLSALHGMFAHVI